MSYSLWHLFPFDYMCSLDLQLHVLCVIKEHKNVNWKQRKCKRTGLLLFIKGGKKLESYFECIYKRKYAIKTTTVRGKKAQHVAQQELLLDHVFPCYDFCLLISPCLCLSTFPCLAHQIILINIFTFLWYSPAVTSGSLQPMICLFWFHHSFPLVLPLNPGTNARCAVLENSLSLLKAHGKQEKENSGRNLIIIPVVHQMWVTRPNHHIKTMCAQEPSDIVQ